MSLHRKSAVFLCCFLTASVPTKVKYFFQLLSFTDSGSSSPPIPAFPLDDREEERQLHLLSDCDMPDTVLCVLLSLFLVDSTVRSRWCPYFVYKETEIQRG